jgi:hypothetical protein
LWIWIELKCWIRIHIESIRIHSPGFKLRNTIKNPDTIKTYVGKQMNDEKTAADYKVQGGSVLHLVLALR